MCRTGQLASVSLTGRMNYSVPLRDLLKASVQKADDFIKRPHMVSQSRLHTSLRVCVGRYFLNGVFFEHRRGRESHHFQQGMVTFSERVPRAAIDRQNTK